MHKLTLLLLLLPFYLPAQFPITPEFQAELDHLGIRVNHPFDDGFKLEEPSGNPYLAESLRMYSRKEKLELRFGAVPYDPQDQFKDFPNIRAGHLVLNLASNEEGAVTTVLSLDQYEMDALNADWAMVYIFRPKRSLSDRKTAQLVASYKEDRGIVYTLLLYNKVPETMNGRQMALRWRVKNP